MIAPNEPSSTRSPIIEIAFMLGLFALATLLLDGLPFPSRMIHFSILGCVPLLLSSKPKRSDLRVALLLSAIYCAEAKAFGHSWSGSLALGPGLASIQTLFYDRHRTEARIVIPVALLCAFWIYLFLPFVVLVTVLTPNTIDATLHTVDFGIGDAFYRFACSHLAVSLFFQLIYTSLPFAMAVVISLRTPAERRGIALSLMLASFAAMPLYLLFPAVGPIHIHNPTAQRNCIPSMHFSWAIMLCAFSDQRWLRNLMIVFAALTAIATLTTGEHYVIDLIVAFPFTYLFLRVVRLSRRNLQSVLVEESVRSTTAA